MLHLCSRFSSVVIAIVLVDHVRVGVVILVEACVFVVVVAVDVVVVAVMV